MAQRLKASERAAVSERDGLSEEIAALRKELALEQENGRTQTKASRAAAAAHADEIMHCTAQAAELSAQVLYCKELTGVHCVPLVCVRSIPSPLSCIPAL